MYLYLLGARWYYVNRQTGCTVAIACNNSGEKEEVKLSAYWVQFQVCLINIFFSKNPQNVLPFYYPSFIFTWDFRFWHLTSSSSFFYGWLLEIFNLNFSRQAGVPSSNGKPEGGGGGASSDQSKPSSVISSTPAAAASSKLSAGAASPVAEGGSIKAAASPPAASASAAAATSASDNKKKPTVQTGGGGKPSSRWVN